MNQAGEQASTGTADWQRRARCREHHQSFFPVEDEQPTERAVREELARSVCRGCPVRQPCLDLALQLDVAEGIWGGMTQRERRRLRRRPAPPRTE